VRSKKRIEPIDAEKIATIFQRIESQLKKEGQHLHITVVGGVAIILLGLRDRATLDIDIAPTTDATLFQKVCGQLGIPVDIITIASTVDLVHVSGNNFYEGPFLTVDVVAPEDLIKMKLERFYKQDPEDIYAIIDQLDLPYESFERIARDMLIDFVGDPRALLLSIKQVVEVKYPPEEFA